MRYALLFFKTFCFLLLATFVSAAQRDCFNDAWRFKRLVDKNETIAYALPDYDDSTWEVVRLPHTAKMEPLLVNDQWQGLCWYRKSFDCPTLSADKKYYLHFEAAMNKAEVWINGRFATMYQGGYLPFVIDASSMLRKEKNIVAVRLNNMDNPITGPKPLQILDYNMYGGIYRNVWMITKNKVHITDPLLSSKPADGGVFVSFPSVSEQKAEVRIQTTVANDYIDQMNVQVNHKVSFKGKVISEYRIPAFVVQGKEERTLAATYAFDMPKLWSPDAPNLYVLETTVLCDNRVVDSEKTTFGIREFTFKNNQLYINGKKTFLRGVNRHQEYPYVGYALSDNANYRDAVKIKQAGFDYVRLSHYPHSPAFMKACDELGLVVADAILGWQYYKEDIAFKNQQYESARRLIRRDRNHPCVMAWEVSLNETKMPIPFMQVLHDIVHEEYPYGKTYSCGWQSEVYDIYFQARQHRIMHKKEMTFEKPYMVSEYGDWEYYSNNAGLNQHNLDKDRRLEMSSRQLRSDGEVRLLQQAFNVQEAHNDNLSIPATADSYWVMFDYNRGYHNTIESSGIMDIFRLPKFSYDFYRSQRDAAGKEGVVLAIANYWSADSPTDVKVYSNCDKVALYLNNKKIATQTPDKSAISTHLKHGGFTFKVPSYKAGTLKAVGYLKGKKVKTVEVKTAGKLASFAGKVDCSGVEVQAGCNDVVFFYISAVDKDGTLCTDFTDTLDIQTDDKVALCNTDGVQTEAGIATLVLRIGNKAGNSQIKVKSANGISKTFDLTIY